MPEYYHVGKIVNTHGIRGEVRVITTTDFPEERFQKGKELFILVNPVQKVTITSVREHKGLIMLTFKGFADINEVLQFKGATLAVADQDLQELDDDEYYYKDIIGLTIKTEAGDEVGVVADILSYGANDVWTVKRKGKKDLLLPFIGSVVLTIDVANKVAVVDIPEGLDPDEN